MDGLRVWLMKTQLLGSWYGCVPPVSTLATSPESFGFLKDSLPSFLMPSGRMASSDGRCNGQGGEIDLGRVG